MHSRLITRTIAVAAGLAAALGGAAVASAATARPGNTGNGHHQGIQHVLLISVDGMHQSDLDWYIANHPNSELARLATGGAEYTDAQTADPSDSDPGGTALMTGRSLPASTPPGPQSIRATRRWSSKRPTTTGCCGGCQTARRRRLTSSRTTCGRIPLLRSTTPGRRSPSSTPACGRSLPASSPRTSSASRSPTRIIQTCSGSRRSARSTRPARRSPNTAATTRATGTFRLSSMRRAPSTLAR